MATAVTTSNPPNSTTGPSIKLTCIACRLEFTSFENQRQHYHTDWHRYNLKRKVANLPPVTLQNFDARLKAAQQEEKKDTDEIKVLVCTICNKHFSSEKRIKST